MALSISPPELLEHDSFLKSLARDLVGDDGAEDVVQEAMLAALVTPPRKRESLRGWLAIVVSNRARNWKRGEGRRGRREQHAARPEAEESDSALDRFEVQRVLTELVAALPETQRTILYLRYYEGLSMRDIGRRMDDIPIAKVSWQHARALEVLRRQLDARSGGDRLSWVSALVPLTKFPRVWTTRQASSMKVGAAIVVVSTACLLWKLITSASASDGALLAADDPVDGTRPEGNFLEAPDHQSSRPSHRDPVLACPLLQGQVRSQDGPVADALVRWLALEKKDTEDTPSWPTANWGVPERSTVQMRTDMNGHFEFMRTPAADMSFGSLLIVTHKNHYARGVDLPASEVGRLSNIEVVLETATPIAVQVVDIAGRNQSGATVHHGGMSRRPTDLLGRSIHQRFLAEEAHTDASGRADLAPFLGEQAIWAEKGRLVSVPWQGRSPSTLLLRLGESFTIGGRVMIAGRELWEDGYEGERRVLVLGLTGNLWRPLVHLRDVAEGKWGPLRVPLDGVSRYSVRLEGFPIIPMEESFDPPHASTHQNIDFNASSGVGLYLLVKNESGEPILTSHAEAWWEPGVFPKHRVTGAARPDGLIFIGTFPPGCSLNTRVAAPGYASQDRQFSVLSYLPVRPVTDPEYRKHFEIQLAKGGTITGRCVHEGSPVADFQVIYWKSGNLQFNRSESFFGREDGRFEIEGLTPSDWAIHAASPAFPCGRPLIVSVNAERNTEVELELPTAIRGGGTVVAADSGEPVPDAHVQPYYSGGSGRSYPWGPGALSASDGTFELDSFVLGVNHLTIEADGFAFAEADATATDTDFLDWGDIRLFRPQTLQVTLLGLGQGVDPSGFRARTEQGHLLPETRFDPQGTVRFEAVPPGDHRLIVYYPDGSWGRLQLNLDPGKEWKFALKVAGDRRLDVHVVDATGGVPPNVTGVYWTAQEETGVFVVRFDWTEDGHATIEGIQATQGQLWVLASDDSILATKDVAFGADSAKAIEIRLGEEQFRVRVVDNHHEPIPGAWVTIRSASGTEIHGADDTDPDGWAELGSLPAGPLRMDVQHAVVGRCFGVPVDASAKELEFVLEASGSLELELVDGDVTLAGVLTRIQTKAGLSLDDPRQTDDQGRVRYESLGEGNYHLACHRADCWPVLVDEELTAGEQARVQVQMRRLADLEFTLFNADGLPVSGAEVELTSEEFEVPVATWIQEERVRAPNGLTTDTRGTVRVEGLPRGAYSWSLTAGERDLSGSFELAPAKTNRVPAFLQAQK